MVWFRHFIHFIINSGFLRPQTFLNRNLDLPENIAAVDKRKIYTFHFGNQRQNMSSLPVSSSNNETTAPGRKWHACRSWASQSGADLPKIGPASNNNITHRSLYVCKLKNQRLAAVPSPHYFHLLPLLENPQSSDAISNSQDNQQITEWSSTRAQLMLDTGWAEMRWMMWRHIVPGASVSGCKVYR